MDGEMGEFPGVGRCFEAQRRVRLGDLDRHGRLRVDAIARYAQDVASDDAVDGTLHGESAIAWVVRRTTIVSRTPATYRESLDLATWCSGYGSRWAERRTTLRGAAGATIDTVSLWVQVDAETGAPRQLDDDFHRLYAPSAEGRTVSSRLTLPANAPDDAAVHPWQIRRADLDPRGHVNNAATWAAVEELADPLLQRLPVRATLEYRAPVLADQQVDIRVGHDGDALLLWLTADGVTAAVSLVEPI